MSVDRALTVPAISTGRPAVDRAWRIAIGDLLGNIQPFKDGLLERPQPVLLAGLDYDTPWTRDAAINVWNGVGLLWPVVARNTLLSVLERKEGHVFIGGQYWDAIIWAIGGWSYFLYTGDREFLAIAFEAVSNSLARFESEEFDPRYGLFRGPAVYGDGVAAYPRRYSPGGTSSILDWIHFNPQQKSMPGYGLPMMSLSTNCVYYQAYRIARWMAETLSPGRQSEYAERAGRLREAIQEHFWDPGPGTFRYLVDPEGGCDHQEGLGHSFALIFDIASEIQAHSVLSKQTVAPAGIPCVWPTYERYAQHGGYGRHSGTIWPFISGFWGEAALKYGRPDLFEREFDQFTAAINRHDQCAEIYHPISGEVYGGLQEGGQGATGLEWKSCSRQSWTASAYLRMLLSGIAGLHCGRTGLRLQPSMPAGMDRLSIRDLPYRNARLQILIEGAGRLIASCSVNGVETQPDLAADAEGEYSVVIRMKSA